MMTNRTGFVPNSRLGEGYVAIIMIVAGLGMLGAGIWAWLAPLSFAQAVAFSYHEHFLHDLGVFQIGIGVALLVAMVCRDARAVALTALLTTNILHAVNHAYDRHLGGHDSDAYLLAALSLLVAAALVLRLRDIRRPAAGKRQGAAP